MRTFEKAKNEKWFTKLISVFISNLCGPKHHHIFSTWVVERTIIRNFITNGHLCIAFMEEEKKRTKLWNSQGFLPLTAQAFNTSAVKCRKSNSSWRWGGYSKPKLALCYSFLILNTILFPEFVLLSLDLTFLHQKNEQGNSIIWLQQNHSFLWGINSSVWRQNPMKSFKESVIRVATCKGLQTEKFVLYLKHETIFMLHQYACLQACLRRLFTMQSFKCTVSKNNFWHFDSYMLIKLQDNMV